jgi:transcriptional/translational regulatory protein YebC/TACO1
VFRIPKSAVLEDDLFLLITEAGAEDLLVDEEAYTVYTSIEAFIPVKDALTKRGVKWEEAELAMVPKTLVEVGDEEANRNIALIEYLEGLDDVDAVYHNMK